MSEQQLREVTEVAEEQLTIFPASLALRALRSTSYKNTAYAVAELIDNSFDAQATEIGVVLLVEDDERGSPHTVAVLDNGRGMAEETLRRSIQYGFSGQDSALDKPLGKFGVGLVAASFSQCSDLTVMSWQDSEAANGSVSSTGIRVVEGEEIDNDLPTPRHRSLPDWASGAFVGMATPIADMKSGSLVVWRGVEPSWKRAQTLADNLADLCGRIYRNFIGRHRLTISINVYSLLKRQVVSTRVVPAVDPTFLTNWAEPSLSEHGFSGDNTLFIPYTGAAGDSGLNQAGEYEPELITVRGRDGKEIGCCLLTASYRNPRVLDVADGDPGPTRYGRLAKRLQGVSILRSQREIDLDPSWLRLSLTVDRWVSVSLDFDPDLDATFGITNDKQKAHRLADVASLPLADINERIRVFNENEEVGQDESTLQCLTVARDIKTKLNAMQRLVKEQRTGKRSAGRGSTSDPSHAPTPELRIAGMRLADGGHAMPQDRSSAIDFADEVAEAYQESTSDGEPARKVRPPIVIRNNLKVDFVTAPNEVSSKIFDVKLSPAHMIVLLNAQHPLYESLSRLLRDDDRPPDEPEPTIHDALEALRGLLVSYARAQVEAEAKQRNEFERCALSWGEVAWRLFQDPDE